MPVGTLNNMTHTQRINYLKKYIKNLKGFASDESLTVSEVTELQAEISRMQKELYETEKLKLNESK